MNLNGISINLKSVKNYLNLTKFFFSIISIIFLVPIFLILASLFDGYSATWEHLIQTVLVEYISNSLLLVCGVSFGVFILGVSTAWLVTACDFKGKGFFKWSLILPLSIPPYIMAYAFTGLFDSSGSMNTIIQSIFNLDSSFIFFPSVRNIPGAIIIFSFTLYPYVYLISQTAFVNLSRDVFDTARTLGLSKKETFLQLALPLARPAIIAGLMIVAMETISDFGAVEHFAIPTFTTGIFRAWFGMNDITTAKQLAALLFILFLFFLIIEKYSRKKIKFNQSLTSNRELVPVKLTGLKGFSATLLCSIPIVIGFIIPISQLCYWAISYNMEYFDYYFISSAINTIYLAILSGIFCVAISVSFNYLIRVKKNNAVVSEIKKNKNISTQVSEPIETEVKKVIKSEDKESSTNNNVIVKSPMIGTFYRSPNPESDPFVSEGDSIKVGQKVCIIEAMKLFNDIESEISGKIVKILVDDNSPVEFDQPLFEVDPS